MRIVVINKRKKMEDKMKKIIFAFIQFTVIYFLNAQVVFDNPNSSFNPNYSLGSFLNPDMVKMNHSMSFMSGVSSRGDGFYQSTYTNHLQFQLQRNLRLNVDLSVVNLGSMSHNNNLNFSGNNDNQSMVVPSFSLEYRPTENSTIYFEYRQNRGYYTPLYRRADGW